MLNVTLEFESLFQKLVNLRQQLNDNPSAAVLEKVAEISHSLLALSCSINESDLIKDQSQNRDTKKTLQASPFLKLCLECIHDSLECLVKQNNMDLLSLRYGLNGIIDDINYLNTNIDFNLTKEGHNHANTVA